MVAATEHADAFRALADPTRREVLLALGPGERSVGELHARFRSISQPALSQHLGVLRGAGLVEARKAGRRRMYRLKRAGFDAARAWLHHFDRFWEGKLHALGQYLDAQARGETQAPAPNVEKPRKDRDG